MKYFLGYETTDRKIAKIDNNGIVDASTDLFDIVDFKKFKKRVVFKRIAPS